MSEMKGEVQRLAAKAVAMLNERAGGRLDYSPESLLMIEDALGEAASYFSELPDDQVSAIVQQVGCYILEVAYRQFGGSFFWHEELDQPVFVTGEPEMHIAIVTWSKVRGRVAGDSADNIPFFYSGFAERVKARTAGARAIYV